MANAARLLDRLVAQLTADGDLTPDWREAFLAVPRHAFIPATVWRHDPEIGTGTGYNTALLAHRLGARNAVSMEIDEALTGHAQRALKAAGYDAVMVLTGDGALGHRDQAPYDRVLCTASVQHVPHAWVAQSRAGGRILTPWANAYFDGGLLALEPLGDGTATGRIVGKAWFMWLRDQRVPRVSVARFVRDDQHVDTSTTEVHPFEVAGDYDAQLAVGLRVPDYGPRRLWDDVEAAYRWWKDAGGPQTAD